MKFAIALMFLSVSAAHAQKQKIADVLAERVCYGRLDNGSGESDSKGGAFLRFRRDGSIEQEAKLTPAAFNNPRAEINGRSAFTVRNVSLDDGKELKLVVANYDYWNLRFDPRTNKLTGTADPRHGRGHSNFKVWQVEMTCEKR